MLVAVAKLADIFGDLGGDNLDALLRQRQRELDELYDDIERGLRNPSNTPPRDFWGPATYLPPAAGGNAIVGWSAYNVPNSASDAELPVTLRRVFSRGGSLFDSAGYSVPPDQVWSLRDPAQYRTDNLLRLRFDSEGNLEKAEALSRSPLSEQDTSIRLISFAQLGSILGANLGRALAPQGDPWAALAQGSLFATIGLNIGQAIAGPEAIGYDSAGINRKVIESEAFGDFPIDLASAGLSAVSSFLISELVEELGLEGASGGLVTSTAGALVAKVIDNYALMARGVKWVDVGGKAVELSPTTGVNAALLANAVGSFLGGYLAPTPRSRACAWRGSWIGSWPGAGCLRR